MTVGIKMSQSLPTLSPGSTSEDVRFLQRLLNCAGYSPVATDAKFGEQTEAAVKQFQTDRNLSVDGIVGPQTWWQFLIYIVDFKYCPGSSN